MPYTPDPTNVSQPDGATIKASTAAPEFRALKAYIQNTILAQLVLKAPINAPHFTGAVVFDEAPVAPTRPTGTADTTLATTAFVAATALSAVLPGATGAAGLSLSSNGTDASFSISSADALAILNYLGAI